MKNLICSKLSIFFILLISCSLYAQEGPPINDTLAQRLQNVLDDQLIKYELQGISSAAIMPDNAIWLGASGMSHPGYNMETDMLFWIGSIAKTFTAAVVLQLAEEGLLNLEDSLHQWLPSYPHIDSTITIRQLLNQTSGIYNVQSHELFYSSILDNPDKYWAPEEIILTYINEPYFSPGAEDMWEISHTNYHLLGMIIEQATQSELATEMQNRLADPLQLKNTHFIWSDSLNDHCAHPWWDYPENGTLDDILWFYRTALWSINFGSSDIISTAEEIAIWTKRLFEAELFSQTYLEQMLTYIPIDYNGPPRKKGYGLGVTRYTLLNREIWGHGGAFIGYTNQVIYYYEDSVSISVCINEGPAYEERESISTELLAYVLSFLHGYPKVEYKLNSNLLVVNPKWSPAIDSSLCIYNRGWGKDTIDISIDYRSLDSSAISVEPSSFELTPGDSQLIKLIIDPNFFKPYPSYLDLIINSKFNYLSSPIEEVQGIMTPIDKLEQNIPNKYVLHQNYPNPFNPKTIINYELPARSEGGPITNYVELSIYNVLGQKVATLVSRKQNAGFYSVEWDAGGFASGVYYYRLQAGEYVDCKKLVLLK